jgi:hypothetical protein
MKTVGFINSGLNGFDGFRFLKAYGPRLPYQTESRERETLKPLKPLL